MVKNHIPGTWQIKIEAGKWKVLSEDGKLIATITDTVDAEAKAKLIAASPYMLEALKGIIALIGDEDLPDNGELSGAAVCDMARSVIELVSK